jgi:hypothetical protein
MIIFLLIDLLSNPQPQDILIRTVWKAIYRIKIGTPESRRENVLFLL